MLPQAKKGRGATGNPDPRYLADRRESFDDGWSPQDLEVTPITTSVTDDPVRTIISRNDSPDIPFRQSINPYKGCEHGCVYCYARPSHAYLDLSPGLDFETRLFAKHNAADVLKRELAKPGYRCDSISIGANTDPYQPSERSRRITRSIIEVLAEHQHPFGIVTKSSLVERDIDVLAPLAAKNLTHVIVSVTTLDRDLARRMEPRAAAPQRRLQTVARLHQAGVPVGVLFAPIIPFLNDADMEAVLEAAATAGASFAGYVVLRLPYELTDIFKTWLETHYPLKAEHVMNRIRDMRGGKDYDSEYGSRIRGTGVYAELLKNRFAQAAKKFGLNRQRQKLDTSQFVAPNNSGQQDLFR